MQLQLVLLFCLLFLASTVSAGPEVRSDLWITNGPIYSTEVYGSNVGSASGSSVLLDTETALMDTTWPVVSGGELKVAVSDDAGGWYIGGSFSSVGSVALNNLAHINPDHSVDTAWVPVVNGVVHTIVLAGNTLVIGGEFTQVEGDTRNHLAALFTNTTKNLLTNWDPNANGNVFTMVLSGNNLVVGGAFTQLGTTEEVTEETNTGPVTKIINPVARIGLAELSPSVPLNSTTDWSPTLIGGSATVYSLAVIGETLYVGGDFTSIEHITGENKVKTIVPRNNIAALQMNVTQDIVTNWDPNANGIVRNVFLSGDKLYAGGEFTNIGGVNRSFIAALDTTQEILNATDWDPGADAIVRTIVQSGATVYVGGDFTTIGGQARNYIAALDPQSNSGDATSWYPKVDNTVTNIIVSGNEIVAGGLFNSVIDEAKIYIAGDFTYVGPNTGPGVTVDASSAVIDSTWPYVEGAINSVVPDGAGGWFIGGIFSAVGGITRSNIAHIDNTKSLDTNWNPIIDGPVNDLILSGADLYVGGAFADVNGTPRNNIAVIGSGGTGVVNTTWNPNINGPVNTMILSAPDLYVGGAFTDVGGGTARNNIAAVESVGVGAGAGAVNATWNPNINGPVNTMILSAPDLYVGGAFTDVGGGTARNNIAAVESVGVGAGAGAVNATWNPGANGTVTRLLFSASNIYVGGDFTRIGGLNRDRLAEISIASPVSVMNWDPSIGDTINSLMLDGTTLFVGGDFTSTGGVTRNYVAAIDQITGIPTSWNPSANNVVYSIALSDAGDRLFLGGSFTSVGGQSRSKIAAISTATGIADAWNPGADGDIRSMLLTSGGLFVGGDFTLIDGAFRNRLARLNVVNTNPGSIVFGWDPDVNNTVRTMAMRGSTLYIGGDFFTVNGGFNPRFFIAALDSNQADAKDWAPDADGPVYSLLINNDILYAGGEFNTIDKKTRKFIAALDTANTDNIAIDWKVGVDAPVKALSISGDDSTLYIGGEFVNVEVETVDANNDPVILTKSHNRLAALALERDEAQKIISASPLDWWNASSSASVLSMTLSGDGNMLYTGGDFGAINNATQTGLAAFEVLPPFTSALPASNSFQGAQNITLSCNDGPGTGCVATYYTNDDTTPTLLSNVYTTNIPVSVDTTIQYFSVDQSGNQEKARSTKYVIDDQAPTVTAKPVGGTYGTTADRTIELNCVDVGNAGCDAIYYTTGETPETTDIPTFTSTKYDSPIDVTENTTIKFFAVDKAGNFETFIPQGAGSPQAAISVETYEIDLDLPRTIITPDSKVFTSQSLTITLKCDDVPEEQEELPGADPNAPVEETPTSTVTGCNAIYYTLDDTTPTLTSTRYTTPIRINDSTVIKYRSVDNAGNVEPTKRSTYIKNYGGFGTVGVVMVVLSMLGIVLQQRYRRVI